ncbi:MAG: hypothetical protein Q7R96_05440 [Nanoarchaeota archaeon]|nr:hypothetical protein [Nanoarchaeota archaeon]
MTATQEQLPHIRFFWLENDYRWDSWGYNDQQELYFVGTEKDLEGLVIQTPQEYYKDRPWDIPFTPAQQTFLTEIVQLVATTNTAIQAKDLTKVNAGYKRFGAMRKEIAALYDHTVMKF